MNGTEYFHPNIKCQTSQAFIKMPIRTIQVSKFRISPLVADVKTSFKTVLGTTFKRRHNICEERRRVSAYKWGLTNYLRGVDLKRYPWIYCLYNKILPKPMNITVVCWSWGLLKNVYLGQSEHYRDSITEIGKIKKKRIKELPLPQGLWN